MTRGLPSSEERRLEKNAKIAEALRGRKRPGLVKAAPLWVEKGAWVQALVESNLPVAEISRITGVKSGTIYDWVSKQGWEYHPPASPKTSTKGKRVLSTVLALFDADYIRGEVDISDIALRSGLSEGTVYRLVHEYRQSQWEDLKGRHQSQKVCSGPCGRRLSLGAFPVREDRDGKTHSLCFDCRKEWAQKYRREHPEPIRRGSRKRRAIKTRARHEHYDERAIWERDGGRCHLCGGAVDFDLPRDDPASFQLDHVHPLSKRGPDTALNVRASHKRCNQVKKDRYVAPWAQWAVARVDYGTARDAVVEHHYLHKAPNVSYAYGLYEGGALQGVVTFGSPTSRRTAEAVSADPSRVIELNRLWVADGAPFGAASWFLARALKMLPAFIVVALSDLSVLDTRYGTAHTGAIYRACSFRYHKQSKTVIEWRLPGSSRHVPKSTPGAVPVQVSPKNSYWTYTGSPTDKRALRRLCKWEEAWTRPSKV